MARRIDSGEFDGSPVMVFRAAQGMEHVLTNWTWLDEAFSAPVGDFGARRVWTVSMTRRCRFLGGRPR